MLLTKRRNSTHKQGQGYAMKMSKEERRYWLNNLADNLYREDGSIDNDIVANIIIGCNDLVWANVRKWNFIDEHSAVGAAQDGLLKAIYSYKKERRAGFLTYASVCIYNELGMLYRKVKRYGVIEYLDSPVADKDGNTATHKDLLAADTDVAGICVSNAMYTEIQKAIDEVINSYDNKTYLNVLGYWKASNYTAIQDEIAIKFGFSQSYVSRILKQFKNDLLITLNRKGVLLK